LNRPAGLSRGRRLERYQRHPRPGPLIEKTRRPDSEAIDEGYHPGRMSTIPFNRPGLAGDELRYIEQAVASGHTSCGGPFSLRASEILRSECDALDVLLTTSCTDALEMSAMLLDVGPGDVVIVPSFTFTSTALAYARAGASVRFCDIDPVSLCLDPADVEVAIDERVKAVVTVHYAGNPSDVDALGRLADSVGAALVEDNAHGLYGRHRGRPLGSFGRMSTLSFHETKNFICGEGGALVLNDERDVDAAHVLLDKGTNRRQFLDGLVDKYSWQGLGSSFGLSDILAAFLTAQLEQAELIRGRRRRVSEHYRDLLAPLADELDLVLPLEPPESEPADHMFYVLLPPGVRSEVLASMRADGVHATFHYVPLHGSAAGRRFCDEYRECPVTDDVSSRLLRLPFYNDLTTSEIERSAEALVRAVTGAVHAD
jgi:dTDP-4-amino-4,6-dideoxygalactose transaminase